MDYKINLFNTLEINQEQFHFQGVTGDQLGIEQQIKDIKKTPSASSSSQINTLLANFCHLQWPQRSWLWYTKPENNKNNNDGDKGTQEQLLLQHKAENSIVFISVCLG